MSDPHTGPDSGKAPGEAIRRHFGAKAGRYAELDVFSQEMFYQPLLEAAAPQPGERALDLACGTGLLALMLARAAGEVVGCDISAEMLERAAAAAAAAGVRNVTFVETEASSLPFEDEWFDLVTSRTAFHHFPDPQRALAEVVRVLKPGGRFAMEDIFGPDDAALSEAREEIEKALDPFHVRAYSITALRNMLGRAGLAVSHDSRPETVRLPLEVILRLEEISDPAEQQRVVAVLRKNLGRDLAGFRVDDIDGRLSTKWETVIISATRE